MPSSSRRIPRQCWPTCGGISTAAMAALPSRPVTSPVRCGSTSTINWPATDHPATEGRHPFPTPPDVRRGDGLARYRQRHRSSIAYDDTGGLTAGRLAVMLRMLGCDAAVLAGGLARLDRADRDRARRAADALSTSHAVEWPTRSPRRRRRCRTDHRRRRRRHRCPLARSVHRRRHSRSTSAPATSRARQRAVVGRARRRRPASTGRRAARPLPRSSASTTSARSSRTADPESARA